MAHTTNFKTYEAQARLLAALVASLDDKRLDYKSKTNSSCPSPQFLPLCCFLSLLWSSLHTGLIS